MSEKSNESIGDIISSIVESVGEVVSDVIESIEHGVEALLEPEEDKEAKTVKKDETKEVDQESRIGYLPALPQAEEPEEESIEPFEESDAKSEIEAAIAKARETGTETIEKDELVADSLPELPRNNSAKLYLQSPNRIFLYWSIAGNPFETLQKAFGSRANNYQLVTKLINLQTKAESFAPANFEGSWWYNVRSNVGYRVDLGFYAVNRPFIRLLSSNSVNTPRAEPSPHADTDADWVVSTKQFVQVLTASGYSHDVFGVAFGANAETGETSEDASTLAVANRFAPVVQGELDLTELRWLLVSLAAGVPFADLQAALSPAVFAWLEQVLAANPNSLEQNNVRTVLESIFGSEFVEMFTDENAIGWMRLAPVAVGASAIHFPEILFPQLRFPELRAATAGNPFDEDYSAGNFSEDSSFPSSAEFLHVSSSEFIDW
ncbi:MAG: DUF4912 domain-containing protein [Pyrinomonadaceae bacterium]